MIRRSLVWIERGLLVTGTALAVWCSMVLIGAEYVRHLPLPPPASAGGATTLPGDATEGTVSSHGTVPPGTWVARLEAPTARLTATVLEGSGDDTLARAAGHIEDTPFPGEAGNVGIAGHRDTIFRPVRQLHVGDPLVVTTANHVYRYRVVKTLVVNPDDVWVLDPTGRRTLTLVTCYPFEFIGHAPRRFIVSADLVAEEVRTTGH